MFNRLSSDSSFQKASQKKFCSEAAHPLHPLYQAARTLVASVYIVSYRRNEHFLSLPPLLGLGLVGSTVTGSSCYC